MKVLWLEVTKDEYELPLAVADTQSELAKMRGTTKEKIRTSYSKYKLGITPLPEPYREEGENE